MVPTEVPSFRKAKLPVLHKDRQKRNQKGHNGRHTVKVSGNEPGSQENQQKYQNRQKGRCPSLTIFPHVFVPLYHMLRTARIMYTGTYASCGLLGRSSFIHVQLFYILF